MIFGALDLTGAIMKTEDRKAAVAAYKERKAVAGIYAVRCLASGQCWVGQALSLDTVQNRLWFTLRHGGTAPAAMHAAWRAHGADSFAFEALERLKEEELAFVRDRALRDRLAHWRTTLEAESI